MSNKEQNITIDNLVTLALSDAKRINSLTTPWDTSSDINDYISTGGEYTAINLETAENHNHDGDSIAAWADLHRRAERGVTYGKIICCMQEKLRCDRAMLEEEIYRAEYSEVVHDMFPNTSPNLYGRRAEVMNLERFLFRLIGDNDFLEKSYKEIPAQAVNG